ncbi:uncharacterized protein LOC125237121 [Leguminivora glycinivorella]|uniref:uncharacterized protein LOC125237121 n=1 Tax=Leguminivora glycinivorella TaxID=1035111 RepID=UPI00200DA2BE|nr:uncharacterized protein LOC125237121 [Leguminivora glycinivorella]
MPRRGTEAVQPPEPPKKKPKVVLEQLSLLCPSLDASFTDDEALPPGIVFSDIQQKKWRIGKPIGRGSFGRIYLASDNVDKEVTKLNANYVVKIEPHSNGPLFVEVHCLIRTSQVAKIKAWRQQNKQKRIGMPVYIASGSFIDKKTGMKYRFLVLPRYDIDLHKIIARTKVLDLKNVLVLALQILDVLEYLHNQGYTHSDIKSSNLMLGFEGGKINKFPMAKTSQSFEKETKEVAVLSGKHRRVKSGKARASNYYDDEDYVIKDSKGLDLNNSCDERRLASVKQLRKILNDRDSRTLHRHHAFNLRQLSSYVNYEDMTSSVCSDQSYQKLLDDFGNKKLIRTTAEFFEDTKKKKTDTANDDDIHKEAILSQSNRQIYLLDYGLASKFLDSEGKHKDFGMDARKAHDGTLEYSSRDSHIGAHSRRSDLETLGYNLIDWLTGSLPWKTTEVLAEPDLVHALKKNYMSDIKSFLKTSFKTELYPQFMEKYLEYVTSLEFTEKPDYDHCRSLFKSELMKNADKEVSLKLAEPPNSPMGRKWVGNSRRFGRKNTPVDFLGRNGIKKSFERENVCSLENDLKLELLKQTINISSEGIRKPCTSRNFFVSDADLIARLKKSLMPHDILGKKLSPKNLRSKKKVQKRRGKRTHRSSIGKFGNFMGSAKQFTWAEILAQNPEDIIRKERNTSNSDEDDDEDTCKYRIRKLSDASSEGSDSLQSPLMQKDYLQGVKWTPAMKEVLANFKRRLAGKAKESEEIPEELQGYTPAMVKIHMIKEKREAREMQEAKQVVEVPSDPVTRTTRSMRKKVEKPKTEAKTRRNKSSVDSVKIKEVKVAVEKLDVKKIEPKTKSKAKKKEVKIVERPKSPASKIKRSSPSRSTKSTRTRDTIVPNNRRRLRSSKRSA